MSAISALIDNAVSCVRCGTPGLFKCDCHIRQSCPGCGRVRWYARDPDIDPPNARELLVKCPDCDPVQSDPLFYLDRAGRQIDL